MATTFKLENGKIIETEVIEREYDPQQYVQSLQTQIADMQAGLTSNTEAVTANITELQNKLASVQELIN